MNTKRVKVVPLQQRKLKNMQILSTPLVLPPLQFYQKSVSISQFFIRLTLNSFFFKFQSCICYLIHKTRIRYKYLREKINKNSEIRELSFRLIKHGWNVRDCLLGRPCKQVGRVWIGAQRPPDCATARSIFVPRINLMRYTQCLTCDLD